MDVGDNFFAPAVLAVKMGDNVTFNRVGTATRKHNVVPTLERQAVLGRDVLTPPPYSHSLVIGPPYFAAGQTYTYACTRHCGSSNQKGAIVVTQTVHAVSVANSANKVFAPTIVNVRMGDIISFTWEGTSSHNVIPVNDSLSCVASGSWGMDVRVRSPFTHGLSISGPLFEPGRSYPFVCTPHCARGMRGELRVECEDCIDNGVALLSNITLFDLSNQVLSLVIINGRTDCGKIIDKGKLRVEVVDDLEFEACGGLERCSSAPYFELSTGTVSVKKYWVHLQCYDPFEAPSHQHPPYEAALPPEFWW